MIGALTILYIYIGYAGFIGYAIILLHTVLVMFLGQANLGYRDKVTIFSDSRMKFISNMIEGIKIIKLYGW